MTDTILLNEGIQFKGYKINNFGVILNPKTLVWQSSDKKVSVEFRYAKALNNTYTTGHSITMHNCGCGSPVSTRNVSIFDEAIRKNLLIMAQYIFNNDEKSM